MTTVHDDAESWLSALEDRCSRGLGTLADDRPLYLGFSDLDGERHLLDARIPLEEFVRQLRIARERLRALGGREVRDGGTGPSGTSQNASDGTPARDAGRALCATVVHESAESWRTTLEDRLREGHEVVSADTGRLVGFSDLDAEERHVIDPSVVVRSRREESEKFWRTRTKLRTAETSRRRGRKRSSERRDEDDTGPVEKVVVTVEHVVREGAETPVTYDDEVVVHEFLPHELSYEERRDSVELFDLDGQPFETVLSEDSRIVIRGLHRGYRGPQARPRLEELFRLARVGAGMGSSRTDGGGRDET